MCEGECGLYLVRVVALASPLGTEYKQPLTEIKAPSVQRTPSTLLAIIFQRDARRCAVLLSAV